MKYRVSCYVFMGRECRGMRRTRCFERGQRVTNSLLSFFFIDKEKYNKLKEETPN